MQVRTQNRSRINKVGTVGTKLGARSDAKIQVEVQTSLWISGIQLLRRQQSMSLPAHVRNLENQIFREFTLDRQVILLSVLRADIRGSLSIEKDRSKHRPVHGLIPRRIQDAVKRIRGGRSVLILERQIEHRVVNAGTAAERRFCAELLHHKLFDRIIENAKSSPDACLSGPAEQLSEESVLRAWTPRQTDAWRKRFIVRGRQSNWHSLVACYHQACGDHSRCSAIGTESREEWVVWPDLAGIDGRVLSGTVGLNFLPDVGQWCIQLPPEAII